MRHLRTDLSALNLTPSSDELASLQADGYLADILAELREEQSQVGDAGEAARDALALLGSALIQRSPAQEGGAA